jgi:hypothetical protein
MRSIKRTSGILLGVALCASSARAAIIISDPLTGSGALNGSAPAVDTYNPTDTWSAYNGTTTSYFNRTSSGTAMTATGIQYIDGSAAGASPAVAELNFTPTPGSIYTLTATITPSGGTPWLPFGFASEYNTVNTYNGANGTDGPWLLLRTTSGSGQNSDDLQVFPTATSSGQSISSGANSGTLNPETVSIVLDTTQTDWVASWYINGSQAGTSYTYTTNPTINAVFFGEYNASYGSVSNFSLTAVPEPCSLLILSVGMLGLLGRRRRLA